MFGSVGNLFFLAAKEAHYVGWTLSLSVPVFTAVFKEFLRKWGDGIIMIIKEVENQLNCVLKLTFKNRPQPTRWRTQTLES